MNRDRLELMKAAITGLAAHGGYNPHDLAAHALAIADAALAKLERSGVTPTPRLVAEHRHDTPRTEEHP